MSNNLTKLLFLSKYSEEPPKTLFNRLANTLVNSNTLLDPRDGFYIEKMYDGRHDAEWIAMRTS